VINHLADYIRRSPDPMLEFGIASLDTSASTSAFRGETVVLRPASDTDEK
jgi:hypothetical protein